jgi:hypothetical protein
MVVLEPAAKVLLFVHYAVAAVLAGALVHLAVRLCGVAFGKNKSLGRVKLHTGIVAVSYAACYVLGALVYPTFRIRVRHEYFDRAVRWATGLFEAKEHLATVGLAAAAGLALLAWAMPRAPEPGKRRRALPLFAGLVVVLLAIVGYNVWSGWFLTTLKGV